MKNLNTLFIIAIISLGFISLNSCSKDAGVGGIAKISGKVTYPGGEASNAIVYISYGTLQETTDFDNSTVADATGIYKIDGLEKGDYFISAEYTDELGNLFTTPGYAITIGEKKADLTVDITLE